MVGNYSSMAVSPSEELLITPLHDLHLETGARMVPFAGYSMPVQFEGVKAEHMHTRSSAGLFDVSHMGQILVEGPEAVQQLEKLIPADLKDLPINKQRYGVLTNTSGGILDDLMICRWDEQLFYLVVNAACKATDLAWLEANLEGVDITVLEDRALLALQGPASEEIMAALAADVSSLSFMQGTQASILDAQCYITRSGYTGEDGFEISIPADKANDLARALLANYDIKPVGLGARDTLRLEAGLCLYGHDMNTGTTPVSAGLEWSISKARRTGGARQGGFPGADIILEQMEKGTKQKRAGLKSEGKALVREGAVLFNGEGQPVGSVTSGGFAPSLNGPVSMGYVDSTLTEPGTSLRAMVRGKPLPVIVTPLPFIKTGYKR